MLHKENNKICVWKTEVIHSKDPQQQWWKKYFRKYKRETVCVSFMCSLNIYFIDPQFA
jgi:hypothetical protein